VEYFDKLFGALDKLYSTTKNPDISVIFIDKSGQKQIGRIDELLKTHSLSEISAGLQTLNAPIKAEYIISHASPGSEFIQETDTFDTWFSSSQWPFATLQNTQSGDFEKFYHQCHGAGYDILPFWVMRMLMMGLFVTGEVPFNQVYLHGLVRDQKVKNEQKQRQRS
jgi:valyl-tRNA synthetase